MSDEEKKDEEPCDFIGYNVCEDIDFKTLYPSIELDMIRAEIDKHQINIQKIQQRITAKRRHVEILSCEISEMINNVEDLSNMKDQLLQEAVAKGYAPPPDVSTNATLSDEDFKAMQTENNERQRRRGLFLQKLAEQGITEEEHWNLLSTRADLLTNSG